jgi:stage III sporulation protein AE
VTAVFLPMLWMYLALSIAHGAVGEPMLDRIRKLLRWLMEWSLKLTLYIFTGYMTITGVVSGSTDAVAMKATRLSISGMIPVVGSFLADASEAVIVGAGVMKNAVGIYGMTAILAIFAAPFLKMGILYLLLKITTAFCGIFETKQVSELLKSFTAAMGLLLAMVGSVCVMLLISGVCFLKGVA